MMRFNNWSSRDAEEKKSIMDTINETKQDYV